MEQHIYPETSSVFLFHELNQYCEEMDRLMQGSKLTLKVNAKIDQFLIIDIFFLDNNI